MSDESPQYEAFRAFAKATIALEVRNATDPLKEEIRSLKSQLETRSAPQVITGPPGPAGTDGKDGRDGKDGVDGKPGEKGERGTDGIIGRDGKDGIAGKDGTPGERGERGADGIATREEIHEIIETRMADIQVRTFADVYQGVYQPSQTYGRGQLVTWGGSLWLSKTEAKTKPGESADWQLIVKKGADGKK